MRPFFCNKSLLSGIWFILTVFRKGGFFIMKGMPEERTISAAEYIIESGATVRAAAKKFGVSKSTIHKDVSERLKTIEPQLYAKVKKVLETNKAERHIRGGMATKIKYMKK